MQEPCTVGTSDVNDTNIPFATLTSINLVNVYLLGFRVGFGHDLKSGHEDAILSLIWSKDNLGTWNTCQNEVFNDGHRKGARTLIVDGPRGESLRVHVLEIEVDDVRLSPIVHDVELSNHLCDRPRRKFGG